MQKKDNTLDRPVALLDYQRPLGVPRQAETLTEPTLAEALVMTHPVPDGTRDRLGDLVYLHVAYGNLPSEQLRAIGAQEARAFAAAERDSDPSNTSAVRYRAIFYRRMRACALVLAYREGR